MHTVHSHVQYCAYWDMPVQHRNFTVTFIEIRNSSMNAKLFGPLLYVNLSVDLILIFQDCVTEFLVMRNFLDERKIAKFFSV